MDITDKNIEEMLPHNYPMVLIDKVIEFDFDSNYFLASTKIKDTMPFFDKKLNGISSMAGIELMAQTVGCYAYLKEKLKKPKIGFLLGSRLYNNALTKFANGKEYYIKIKEIYRDNKISSFDCQIFDDSNYEVACATINTYQPENIEEDIN
ncbi:MAG: 3-hydroxylacyl-ACP dehydratase [Candidatus Gastranaerophilaceae bacterium]